MARENLCIGTFYNITKNQDNPIKTVGRDRCLSPKTPKNASFLGVTQPPGVAQPLTYNICPSLIEIRSKTAEKNSAQTNKQTNRQTNRHYEPTNSNRNSSVDEIGDRGHDRHGPKRGGCCASFVGGGGAGFPSNTMWPGLRSTSVPSGIYIHPAVWPQ